MKYWACFSSATADTGFVGGYANGDLRQYVPGLLQTNSMAHFGSSEQHPLMFIVKKYFLYLYTGSLLYICTHTINVISTRHISASGTPRYASPLRYVGACAILLNIHCGGVSWYVVSRREGSMVPFLDNGSSHTVSFLNPLYCVLLPPATLF